MTRTFTKLKFLVSVMNFLFALSTRLMKITYWKSKTNSPKVLVMDIKIKSWTSVLFFNGKKLQQNILAKADRKIVGFHQFFFITASNYDAQEKNPKNTFSIFDDIQKADDTFLPGSYGFNKLSLGPRYMNISLQAVVKTNKNEDFTTIKKLFTDRY